MTLPPNWPPGGHIVLPPGKYVLTETITLESGSSIQGAGFGTNLICRGDFPAIRCVAQSGKPRNISISGIRITRTNTQDPAEAALKGFSDGIVLWGDNLRVSDVWIEDCFVAVQTAERASARDYSTDIVLERVHSSHSNPLALTAQYGLLLRSCSGVMVNDCEWRDAWLDGVKTTRNASKLRFRGGRIDDCGQVYWVTGAGAGDGMDFFAGGQDVVVDGVTFYHNGGNGIVIKTVGKSVALDHDFNPSFGWQRNFIITNCIFDTIYGSAVAVEGVRNSTSLLAGARLADTDEDNRPRASHVKITNCMVSNCGNYGLALNGLDTAVLGCTIRACGLQGILVMENSRDTFLTNCTILGCSVKSPGALPAITIEKAAKRVTILGCGMNGKAHADTAEIVDDGSYDSFVTLHRSGIEVHAGADDVYVDKCLNQYTTTAGDYDAVAVCIEDTAWANERIVIEHTGTEPTGNFRYTGGPGSTYRYAAAGLEGHTLWVKEVGDPDSATGWSPLRSASTVQTLTSDGAVSLSGILTLLAVSGTRAYTLAPGIYEGQRKTLECVVAASSPHGVLNSAFIRGITPYTTADFTSAGDLLELEYHAVGGWRILRLAGAVALA